MCTHCTCTCLLQQLLSFVQVRDEGVVKLVADGHAASGYDAMRGEQKVTGLLLQCAAAANHVLPPALDPRVVKRVREVCGRERGQRVKRLSRSARCRCHAAYLTEQFKCNAPVIMVTNGTSLIPAQSRPSDAMRFTCNM